ncbi:MAG: flagellar assembly peptidoglycan hydrolase FlgJ [Porticoccaceae bacterium]
MTEAASLFYSDIQGLSSLKHRAREVPGEAVAEAAGQFESLFVQMMLKSMRDATFDGGLFEDDALDTYQQMFDQQVSLELSGNGGIGLGALIAEQLGAAGQAVVETDDAAQSLVAENDMATSLRHQWLGMPARPIPLVGSVDRHNSAPLKRAENGRVEGHVVQADSPEEFVRRVWDDAVAAAGDLGVDPAVLIAQSALETGWGKKVIRRGDGGSSFNLFGIKASSGWRGDTATVRTVEFKDGLASIQKAAFRVYDSFSGAFRDYVSFLKENPRYQSALEKVSDSGAFLEELQQAGYATDPRYAQKIRSIIQRESYSDLINELKNSANTPITELSG